MRGEGEISKEPSSPLPELTLECLPGPHPLPWSSPQYSFPALVLRVTSTSLHDPPLLTQARSPCLSFPSPFQGRGCGEGSGSPVGPCVSPWGPSQAQVLDSVLGLGALGLTVRAVFSTAGSASLLLLLVSLLAFDLLHQ